ncbi:MAG TPA: alpha/beta fold hydrolase, partial [Candidatus Competibacteraceae bacterium]|nr:alpha/beta fold hydrolase [Candidatus Competibacteraceae bacterium]
MTEHTVHFPAGSLQLEGLLSPAFGDKGVVIAHPHPLYGGDMNNNVVETLARVYRQYGFTTLRFNFRGVGGSQGSYDEGEGEQEDIKAALDYLLDQGKIRLDLAAYSFGAWVSALARTAQDKVQRLILVAPPVDFCDFHNVRSLPKLSLVVTGER